MKIKRNLSLRRLLHFISRSIARKQLLFAVGFLSAVLNFWLFNVLYSGSKSSEYLEPEASLTGFLEALAWSESAKRGEKSSGELERWAEAASTYLSSRRNVGSGVRTGGVILAGQSKDICGARYEGNPIREHQPFPSLPFSPNDDMLAGGDSECGVQLTEAVTSGWHQGQRFFYRLSVDRPGHYTLRLALVFYHEDEKREDGVELGIDDLVRVRIQCVPSVGRYVVEPDVVSTHAESVGVLEFHTVVFGKEILLDVEGIYTCIGLSLVEVFLHEDSTGSDVGSRTVGDGDRDHVTAEAQVAEPESYVEGVNVSLKEVQGAWKEAESLCSRGFWREMDLQLSSQQKSVSNEVAAQQRYLNEWARRDRLETSSSRYCRPNRAPWAGEDGWTWVEESPLAEQDSGAKRSRPKGRSYAEIRASAAYRIALKSAMDAGAPRATAHVLATEAVDHAMSMNPGSGISHAAAEEARKRVVNSTHHIIAALKRGEHESKRAPGFEREEEEPETFLDLERRRLRAEEATAAEWEFTDEVAGEEISQISAFVPAMKHGEAEPEAPHGRPWVEHKNRLGVERESSREKAGEVPQTFPFSARMCPQRLMSLMGEALRDAAMITSSPTADSARRPRVSSEAAEGDPEGGPKEDGGGGGGSGGGRDRDPRRGVVWKRPRSSKSVSGGGHLPSWLGPTNHGGRTLARAAFAKQALRSGFEAVVAYRAHDVDWPERHDGGGESEGPEGGGTSPEPRNERDPPPTDAGLSTEEARSIQRASPVRLTGFTKDGVTVVMKEVVLGCAQRAQARAAEPSEGSSDTEASYGVSVDRDSEDGNETEAARSAGIGRSQVELGIHGETEAPCESEEREGLGTRGEQHSRTCLSVERMFVASEDIVVDIIVPVSAGLAPRLHTLLPQLERLAKGSECTPLPPWHPLAPTCLESKRYSSAFWPRRIERRQPVPSVYDARVPESASSEIDMSLWTPGGGWMARNVTGVSTSRGRGLRGEAGEFRDVDAGVDGRGRAGGGSQEKMRVLVVSEDPGIEALLESFEVDGIFVPTRAPFSKARAIQDASSRVPDDHIMFVHDADLFPPCELPDALRQTVVRGVQAVNLLLPYEGKADKGQGKQCIYPVSTFGPMAMYGADFRAVGGIEDANSGRWGFEDTSFLHKVMLGENALGVLRVHLPGLVHKWHEITPWKCLVWAWGRPAGVDGEGCPGCQSQDAIYEKRTAAEALGA